MTLRILSAVQVEALIRGVSIEDLLAHSTQLFIRLSQGDSVQCPTRSTIQLEEYRVLTMAAAVDDLAMTVKVVSVPSDRLQGSGGLPATIMVIDPGMGIPRTILNGRHLTALRTAAGSLLATRSLIANQQLPSILVLYGAGLQSHYHADLILRSFPSIHDCFVVNRSMNTRAQTLILSLSKLHPSVKLQLVSQNTARECTLVADIVCFATSATSPLVPSDWIKPGAHINLIGSYTPSMKEIPTSLIRRASKVVVDSRDHALIEAGELLEANLSHTDLIELGELLTNPQLLQQAQSGNITIWKSVGLAAQDVMIASLVERLAITQNIGTIIHDFE